MTTQAVNIKLATTHRDINSRNELRMAKNETRSNEPREITAHGINANLTRISISARARWCVGIADTIVKIVKTMEATTKDVSKRQPFDNIG